MQFGIAGNSLKLYRALPGQGRRRPPCRRQVAAPAPSSITALIACPPLWNRHCKHLTTTGDTKPLGSSSRTAFRHPLPTPPLANSSSRYVFRGGTRRPIPLYCRPHCIPPPPRPPTAGVATPAGAPGGGGAAAGGNRGAGQQGRGAEVPEQRAQRRQGEAQAGGGDHAGKGSARQRDRQAGPGRAAGGTAAGRAAAAQFPQLSAFLPLPACLPCRPTWW